ncbi:MAG: hypothetical protein LBF61_07965, partial [Azoarcus sp.]|nr:hypothetical protein [Azoarcus sp.]
EAVAAAIPFAVAAAAADGPLPIGEIVGGLILAGAAIYGLTCSGNKAESVTQEQSGTSDKKPCPPCSPPVDTKCHQSDSGHTHNGWGHHFHIWNRGQNPDTCKCFWNKKHGPAGTTHFPPEAMSDCRTYSSWPSG